MDHRSHLCGCGGDERGGIGRCEELFEGRDCVDGGDFELFGVCEERFNVQSGEWFGRRCAVAFAFCFGRDWGWWISGVRDKGNMGMGSTFLDVGGVDEILECGAGLGDEFGGRDGVFYEDFCGRCYGFVGLHAASADGLVDSVYNRGVGVFDGHVLCWIANRS